MGDIEIQPYIVCFFVAMGLIAIGATVESWVIMGYLGGIVLAVVASMLIVNVVKD